MCALRLYPATPGRGVPCGCVCFGSGFGCAPPLLAGVLGCVCACVCAPLVPRHSWLGCAAWLCVFGLMFRLHPATPGWGVGVCVFVYALALLVSRHSWLGCAAWMCVFRVGFRLRTPGWGFGVRVCSCARSACTPPLLAWVCGFDVFACTRVSAAPCLSWLGCLAVRVCVLALLVPRHSWLGCVRRGCVCLHSGSGCALLCWLGCWGVCALVCALRLYPALLDWGVRCVCACVGSDFGCAPPLLAGVLGCVCVCARAPPIPRHSWLRFALWVCGLGLGFRLRPASPGWGVGVCVLVCSLRLCSPLVAGVCGVSVCAWARVSAVPRLSWLEF